MKFLTVLLLLSLTTYSRQIIIPKNQDGGWYKPNANLLPGDTVLMTGDYSYINIVGVNGTQTAPIVFRSSGHVRVGWNTPNYSWILSGSYIVIDGVNPYGFTLGAQAGSYNSQGLGFTVSHLEVKYIEIQYTQVGFFSNQLLGSWTDIKIHDCYIHNTNNPTEQGRAEAFYLGNTEPANYNGAGSFTNVEIFNNRMDSLSGDGIQVARTTGLSIHDNRITNYGLADLQDQNTGIIIGGCSTADIENNFIQGGTGTAIQVFGSGDNYIKNNIALKTSTHANCDVIYINGKCLDGPAARVHVIGNTLEKGIRDFIRDAAGNQLVENVGNTLIGGSQPVPTTGFITLYPDGTWKYSTTKIEQPVKKPIKKVKIKKK